MAALPLTLDPEPPERELQQVFHLRDLSSLSVSSVGPMFSVAATGGVFAAQAGWWTLPAVGLIAVPFMISAFVFRMLNQHFPHAGASYHWSARIIGRRTSRFQAWILILAYFASIPPIIIPAASNTLILLFPHYTPGSAAQLGVSAFWVLVAGAVLLGGGKPTARLTFVFLIIEMVALFGLGAYGVLRYHALHVPIHFGPVPVAGILIVAVVAATIMDGWEIDSYASEEAQRPKTDPGLGGILGALLALVFYLILFPLMLSETPLTTLANSVNPLAEWGNRLVPGAPWVVLVPIIVSTAGGLWLTSFILTRALYSMGREGLIPRSFSKLSHNHVPHVAIVVTLGASFGVVALQLFVTSLTQLFTEVLASAGFFLVVEFFLDCVTATVFLRTGHKKLPPEDRPTGSHRLLQVGAIFASAILGGMIIAFFYYGPGAIGQSIDYILGVLLVGGVAFTFLGRKQDAVRVFAGDDVDPETAHRLRGGKPTRMAVAAPTTVPAPEPGDERVPVVSGT